MRHNRNFLIRAKSRSIINSAKGVKFQNRIAYFAVLLPQPAFRQTKLLLHNFHHFLDLSEVAVGVPRQHTYHPVILARNPQCHPFMIPSLQKPMIPFRGSFNTEPKNGMGITSYCKRPIQNMLPRYATLSTSGDSKWQKTCLQNELLGVCVVELTLSTTL